MGGGMLFIVATNVFASRLPERRPTGTPHTRVKNLRERGENNARNSGQKVIAS